MPKYEIKTIKSYINICVWNPWISLKIWLFSLFRIYTSDLEFYNKFIQKIITAITNIDSNDQILSKRPLAV